MERPLGTGTPRDRFVDFIRVVSLLMVVIGHWLAVVVTWQDGTLRGENGLNILPEMWPLTWVFQVMPLFFFVGGFANRKSYESAVRRGGGYAAYVTGRLQRLLIPTVVFLAVGLTVAIGIDIAGLMDDLLRPAARVVTLPLWFLGVYLMVVALAPAMLALHRRLGIRLVLGLVVATLIVDWARFGLGMADIGYLNYAAVWLVVHQLGFLYADGSLRRWAGWMATAGGGALVGLVAAGPYPASLVGISGNEIDNMNPPTLVILALSACQIGIALLVRSHLVARLEGPRVWRVVIGLNRRVMTMFLWHLAAVLPTIAIVYPLGFPQPQPGSAAFWMLRPGWVALQVPMLFVLVTVFGRFESAGRNLAGDLTAQGDSMASRITAAAGAFLAGLGVLGYARLGLEPFYSNLSRNLTILDINAARSLLYLVVALALLRSAVDGRAAAVSASQWGALVMVVMVVMSIVGVPRFTTDPAGTAIHVLLAALLAGTAPADRWADGKVQGIRTVNL